MLRGVGTYWSHLEQREGDQEVLRGVGTHWSHLEHRGGDQEVLRGVGTHRSHLEQRESDHKVLRGFGTHWSHLEQRKSDKTVLRGVTHRSHRSQLWHIIIFICCLHSLHIHSEGTVSQIFNLGLVVILCKKKKRKTFSKFVSIISEAL